ncbi:hypothetical protein FF1_003540 [Malus domestica]
MAAVSSRREAAAEILQAAWKGFSQGNTGSNLFVPFANLIDHLIKLCFHPGQSKAKAINISTEFSALRRMMPLGIIMPIQQSLTISLPTYDGKLSDSLTYDIFSATDLPTISGIGDEAEILSSLQRPKKETVHVDFSCLFDKGLQLEKPELVPFRLTQNMIDGLGITG